jgi:hypothetical protein
VNLTAASNLTNLLLFNNGLTGTLHLPPQLVELVLNGTFISGLTIGSNKALQAVRIEHSPLRGVLQREILEAPSIKHIRISKTQIHGLPTDWQSETLRSLDVSWNNIAVRLATLGIDVSWNNITVCLAAWGILPTAD